MRVTPLILGVSVVFESELTKVSLSRIVIAGTHSGVGKSTVTLCLMAAFRARGLTVQGFKVGPDYIDGSYHTAITGRASRNLDSWMLPTEMVRDVFLHASHDADISIVEGVMGFYDGKGALSNQGSTAEISLVLSSPVLLVIDASGMARSAAAMVKGYQTFDKAVNIAGVIANGVGGEGHFNLIKEAVEKECGVPVVGYLSKHSEIEIPERHLGLIPAIERGEHAGLFQQLSDIASSTINLDAIYALARTAPEVTSEADFSPLSGLLSSKYEDTAKVQIAVAKDAAFNFYYPENFDLLEHYGAELLFFSPLAGELVPREADGLYIGGGFPEEFAALLSLHREAMTELRERIEHGLPTYAECGGYMYLTEQLRDVHGGRHQMVGVIPAQVTMQQRLSGFGYREVTGAAGNWLLPDKQSARGHEFHYSTIEYGLLPQPFAYTTSGYRLPSIQGEGYLRDNVIAGYTHLHFGSNPQVAERFAERCRLYQTQKLER